ncbi:hypothetical protein IMG5_116460 [Ichthyophthirius multifiliis]|uniref:Glutamine amidotransferase type-2 domain-containing protein n=1 Tax=Ichthyophthirius multifiliis TaxID=5932 RepID=G0QUD8_ICHMU|nr:hypothetical protein IMG5_116460 [Ichthyophthirius multifiliis]EGR31175.1 hypothetical protein IMG5_116460 [Ichthyophthirius multifiliis]|eukprot:XP_004034661.1 hypothetical protein IMG5_116460 [Ichthyophthirius multifiliis]
MCGICFCINGIQLANNQINFNLFEKYIRNPYIDKHEGLREKHLKASFDIIKNIQEKKNIINNFDINAIKQSIGPRGPNIFTYKQYSIQKNQQTIQENQQIFNQNIFDNQSNNLTLTFCNSLLHLRGQNNILNIQPITNSTQEQILIYNGEIYTDQNDQFNTFENDTLQLFNILTKSDKEDLKYEDFIINQLNKLWGDYAFIFFDNQQKKIVIAKDPFGKKSLLLGFSENGFAFSSCAININMEKQKLDQDIEEEEEETKKDYEDKAYNLTDDTQRIQFLEKKYLHEFFQGQQKEWIEIPQNTLIIIDIQNPNQFIWNQYEINNILYNIQYKTYPHMEPCIESPLSFKQTIYEAIQQSVKEHIENIIEYKYFFKDNKLQGEQQFSNQINSQSTFTDSKIAVLFSGGLDSTILTYFLDKLLPPDQSIDLLNVSFNLNASSDRKTALFAIQELQQINPNRKYNLILIDKTVDNLKEYEEYLIKLIYPKCTHMDFNIALVLHIATQGKGYLHTDVVEKKKITSGAKIVLSGLGADEIFGGYSRYRVAFQRNGYQDLIQEMNFDLLRLWIRNLGRDDRAISQNGKECRFPFLNQQLIQTVKNNIDFNYFTNFNLPRGYGDKIILRQVALQCGLIQTSDFRKKAIQFGTGLAKQSNIRTFGSNRKAKGCFKYNVNKNKKDF